MQKKARHDDLATDKEGPAPAEQERAVVSFAGNPPAWCTWPTGNGTMLCNGMWVDPAKPKTTQVICLMGMPAAGKSTVAREFLKRRGSGVFSEEVRHGRLSVPFSRTHDNVWLRGSTCNWVPPYKQKRLSLAQAASLPKAIESIVRRVGVVSVVILDVTKFIDLTGLSNSVPVTAIEWGVSEADREIRYSSRAIQRRDYYTLDFRRSTFQCRGSHAKYRRGFTRIVRVPTESAAVEAMRLLLLAPLKDIASHGFCRDGAETQLVHTGAPVPAVPVTALQAVHQPLSGAAPLSEFGAFAQVETRAYRRLNTPRTDRLCANSSEEL